VVGGHCDSACRNDRKGVVTSLLCEMIDSLEQTAVDRLGRGKARRLSLRGDAEGEWCDSGVDSGVDGVWRKWLLVSRFVGLSLTPPALRTAGVNDKPRTSE
jgi:hypothetical protein